MIRNHRSESGNITFVVAGVLVAVGLLFVASLAIARAAIERSATQSAADAVALAGAGGDRSEADRVANANAVRIVSYLESDRAVEATVQLTDGDQTASARAEQGQTSHPVTIDVWIPVDENSAAGSTGRSP
jgi:Putative Flp pilus-assembly TadE/G-like